MKLSRLSLLILILLTFAATSSISQQSATKQSEGPDRLIAVIDAVTFEGATTVSDDVKATIAGALRGESRHVDWLKRFQAKALRDFQDAGFLDAAVETRVKASRQTDGVAHVTMLVAVTEGQRYRIESVKWTGSSPISEGELEHLSDLHAGDFFSIASISTTIAAVKNALAERGFRNSTIAPQFKKSPESAQVTLYLEVMPEEKDANFQPSTCNQPSTAEIRSASFTPSATYDPKRNGQLDIARAEVEAAQTHKKLLVFVGATWCAPCMALERAVTKSPKLAALLGDSFVVVHVSVTEENMNECARKNLPNSSNYPMVYVLDGKGKLLASHSPVDWQSFEGFDPQRIEVFLHGWK